MKPTRRRMLAFLGGVPIAGPLLVKRRTDQEFMKLTGMTVTGPGAYGASGGPPIADESKVTYDQKIISASDYIKTFGVPEVIERRFRQESSWVSYLDPDIACKVSWSMSVKYQEQRARNYARKVHELQEAGRLQRKRNILKTVLGFEWPF